MMIIEQVVDPRVWYRWIIYEKLYQDNGDGTAVLVGTPGQL